MTNDFALRLSEKRGIGFRGPALEQVDIDVQHLAQHSAAEYVNFHDVLMISDELNWGLGGLTFVFGRLAIGAQLVWAKIEQCFEVGLGSRKWYVASIEGTRILWHIDVQVVNEGLSEQVTVDCDFVVAAGSWSIYLVWGRLTPSACESDDVHCPPVHLLLNVGTAQLPAI